MRISDWSSDVCSSDLSGRPSAISRPPSSARKRSGPGEAPASSTSQARDAGRLTGRVMGASCRRGGRLVIRAWVVVVAKPHPPAYPRARRSQLWGRPMYEALVVRRETHIPAQPAAVFALRPDPEKLLRGMGPAAQVGPPPGGPH